MIGHLLLRVIEFQDINKMNIPSLKLSSILKDFFELEVSFYVANGKIEYVLW